MRHALCLCASEKFESTHSLQHNHHDHGVLLLRPAHVQPQHHTGQRQHGKYEGGGTTTCGSSLRIAAANSRVSGAVLMTESGALPNCARLAYASASRCANALTGACVTRASSSALGGLCKTRSRSLVLASVRDARPRSSKLWKEDQVIFNCAIALPELCQKSRSSVALCRHSLSENVSTAIFVSLEVLPEGGSRFAGGDRIKILCTNALCNWQCSLESTILCASSVVAYRTCFECAIVRITMRVTRV